MMIRKSEINENDQEGSDDMNKFSEHVQIILLTNFSAVLFENRGFSLKLVPMMHPLCPPWEEWKSENWLQGSGRVLQYGLGQ